MDIASDIEQLKLASKIAAEFENTTVFLTGGTGFIGKLFLEKLLRISKTVKVLVLVRPKKGKDTATRFQEIFEGPNMVPLKRMNPNFERQVRLINGDCALRDLGLSEEDKQLLVDEVNFVIHCAATVRFDEELKTAAHINVRAVKDLIALAKRMKDLKAFLHVSTAYSFCPNEEIDETIYQPGMTPEALLDLVEKEDQKTLAEMTPKLIKEWPNTYVFTKGIAEDLLKNEADTVPIAILRPSVVISTTSEPVAGWMDNLYGFTGIFLASALGFLRVLRTGYEKTADVIPADYVTNAGFAVLWYMKQKRSSRHSAELDNDEKIPVFNAISAAESPVTWGQLSSMVSEEALKIPTEMQIWYPICIFCTNLYMFQILSFLIQTVPAYLMDGICFCIGKERIMVKAYQKVSKFMDVVSYFSMREWKFKNGNLRALWNTLGEEDRALYPFSMENFDWPCYMKPYVNGIRVYLLKDPLETIPQGRKKFRLLTILHFMLMTVLTVSGLAVSYYSCRLFL